MSTVETTRGPIDVEELGLTLIHEHFRTTDEAARFQFPHLYDEAAEWEVALADADAVKGHGVPYGRRPGRDVPHPRCRLLQARGGRERA